MTWRKWLVNSIGKERKVFPVHLSSLCVFVRKIKNGKDPEFELGKLMELHDEDGSSGKTTGGKTDVKVGQDDAYMDY